MKRVLAITAAIAIVASASAIDGTVVNYSVDGAESWDGPWGNANNMVLLIDTAALLGLPSGTQTEMAGIGWDVSIATVGGSYLSEATTYFDGNVAPDPDGTGLFLTPGSADAFPGAAAYSSGGVLDLEDNGIPNVVFPDGIMRLEFYESYDDVAGAIDANWSGSFDFDLVPEPTSLSLLGLGALALLRRR